MRSALLLASLISLVSTAASASQSSGAGAGKTTVGRATAPMTVHTLAPRPGTTVAINPQPLPPRSDSRIAINPQPLPPRESSSERQ